MPKSVVWRSVVLVVLFSWSQAQSAGSPGRPGFWDKRGYFSANIGFLGSGDVWFSGSRYKTEPGVTYGIKFDLRTVHRYYWGISVDVNRIHVLDTGLYLFDASLNLKKMIFGRSSMVGFRPGVGVGFGYIGPFRYVDRTTYLTCRATLEILFYSETNVAWFVEVGLYGMPLGGNSTYRGSYGPVPLVRIGATY